MSAFVEVLARELDSAHVDLLHAHGWLAGLACQLLPAAAQRPTVQAFRGLRLAARLSGTALAASERCIQAERAVAVHADHVLIHSAAEQDVVTRIGVPRWRVSAIPPGVTPGPATTAGTTTPMQSGRSALARVLVVADPSDVAELARVFSRILGVETVLWVPPVEGAEPGSVEVDAGLDRVRIAQWEPTPARRAGLIRSADIVVCLAPSCQASTVHLEAMESGIPVIAGHEEASEAVVDGVRAAPARSRLSG